MKLVKQNGRTKVLATIIMNVPRPQTAKARKINSKYREQQRRMARDLRLTNSF